MCVCVVRLVFYALFLHFLVDVNGVRLTKLLSLSIFHFFRSNLKCMAVFGIAIVVGIVNFGCMVLTYGSNQHIFSEGESGWARYFVNRKKDRGRLIKLV